MRKASLITVLTVLVAGLTLGMTSMAADPLYHVVAFDEESLVVSYFNEDPARTIESWEVVLAVYDSAYEGDVTITGAATQALVVENGIVQEVILGEDEVITLLPTPAAGGLLIVGHGRGAWFLQQYVIIGDDIQVVERTRSTTEPFPTRVVVASGAEHEITAFNRFRDAMELIVYTPDFGSHTFTNVYGAEATVLNGEVIAVRPYSAPEISAIPEGGFVVSGHNVAGFWIVENLTIGQRVSLEP